jgi:hypothetical protein
LNIVTFLEFIRHYILKLKQNVSVATQESPFSPFHQTPRSSYLSLRKGGDQISKRFNFEIERRVYEVQKSSNIELVKSKAVPLPPTRRQGGVEL